MKRPAIVDTNVVVAGLITRDITAPVARVLNGMLAAAFPFVISEPLLAEYRAVLVRPALKKLHGLGMSEIEALLIDVAHHAIVLTAVPGPPAPDPNDQLLWDLLAPRIDLILVTGDLKLQSDALMRSRLLSPRAFLEE